MSEKPKIDGRYLVGDSGTIRLPIADESVVAKGLTPEQLARRVEKAYRDAEIFTTPTIEVFSNEIPVGKGAQVSIGGQVKRSGPVAFQPGMTLLKAVQAAGDLTPFGTKKRIFLTRGKDRFTLDLRKGDHQSYSLRAGDTIVVDQKRPWDRE